MNKAIVKSGIRNEPLDDTSREEKIRKAEEAYGEFMDVIKPDWRDDPHSEGTPYRVAKMFVNELMAGVNNDPPRITTFTNDGSYDGIVFQGDIEVKSMCSHHHMPFFGKAYVAYIPREESQIVGLSKLNRIVEFCSRRMSVQETLTTQIHNIVKELVGDCQGVAVVIEAEHTCVSHRGIRQQSMMKTAKLSGRFWDNEIGTRQELYRFIADMKSMRR